MEDVKESFHIMHIKNNTNLENFKEVFDTMSTDSTCNIKCSSYNRLLPQMIGYSIGSGRISKILWSYVINGVKEEGYTMLRCDETGIPYIIYHVSYSWYGRNINYTFRKVRIEILEGLLKHAGVKLGIKYVYVIHPNFEDVEENGGLFTPSEEILNTLSMDILSQHMEEIYIVSISLNPDIFKGMCDNCILFINDEVIENSNLIKLIK